MVYYLFAGYVVYYLTLLAIAVTYRILLAVVIFRDAAALGRQDGLIIAILTGLFGSIPAYVYLAVRGRRKGSGVCPSCSASYPGLSLSKTYGYTCPRCGIPLTLYQAQRSTEELEAAEKSHRINKIVYVILFVWLLIEPLFIAFSVFAYILSFA